MATVLDESTFFNLQSFLPFKGQYDASQGTQDFGAGFITPTTSAYNPTVAVVSFISYAPLTHGFHTYYKMQGFNVGSGQYEVWYSVEAPLLSPPSGHTLSNIQVVLTWIDR